MSAQDIRERISMLDVLELVGLDPPAKAHIDCPFHEENTGSLAIWEDHAHCYGCGWHGDVIKFVADLMAGGRRGQAIAYLEGAVDLDAPKIEHKQRELLDLTEEFDRAAARVGSTCFPEAEDFIAVKWPHLSLQLLESYGVKVGRYNLLIPHRDHQGVVRGVKTRCFVGGEKGKKGSFKGSTFTTRLYRAVEPRRIEPAILVEGESDCWTMTPWAAGRFNVYALPSGAQTWAPSFTKELSLAPEVHLVLDTDSVGREASRRIFDTLLAAGVRTVINHHFSYDYKDVTEAVIDGWSPNTLDLR